MASQEPHGECKCAYCQAQPSLTPSLADAMVLAQSGTLLRGSVQVAAVGIRRTLHHRTQFNRLASTFVRRIIEPAVDSFCSSVVSWSPSMVHDLVDNVDALVSKKLMQCYGMVRSSVRSVDEDDRIQQPESNNNNNNNGSGNNKELRLQQTNSFQEIARCCHDNAISCSGETGLHVIPDEQREVLFEIVYLFNSIVDILGVIFEEMEESSSFPFVQSDQDSAQKLKVRAQEISLRKRRLGEHLRNLVSMHAEVMKELQLKNEQSRFEFRQQMYNLHRSIELILGQFKDSAALYEKDQNLRLVNSSNNEIATISDPSWVDLLQSLKSTLSELSNQNHYLDETNRAQSEELASLRKSQVVVAPLQQSLQTLAAEKQALEEKLAQVELFIGSDQGNRVMDLEHQLVQTKLQLAKVETEKDELEMQLEDLRH
eukprot:TRINITY_DN1593_c0_g2_i1.p1 TRINITY_DN1593_c0_g2~~TRINITY_DN1593_c0_g2_i1.p1  ORF type:complete len:440 (+),score=118.41 TRINITY_DN1593_c0_g2_i1:38-1321(+)